MTSREKRFLEKNAEEVKMVLKGYVKCPKCKKFAGSETVKDSFWNASKGPMCLPCRNNEEIGFISDISKEMGKTQEAEIMARTTIIYGDTHK